MREIIVLSYIKKHEARWIERYREVLSFKFLPDGAIEQLTKGVHNKLTSMDREAIEHTETSSMDQEAVE